MKKFIKEKIKELDIEIVGFCNPKNSDEYFDRVEKILKQKENCDFVKNEILNRNNYDLYLKNSKGVIIVAIPYHLNDKKINKDETIFSSSSWGTDYHIILREKLEKLIVFLQPKYPNEKFIALVDSHKLDERYYAYKSGIGFYGKNGLIINEKLGSKIFLGMILTTYKFNDEFIIEKKCMNCNKCEKKCPGNCIGNESIDYNRCLSYLTQKKVLTIEEEKKINDLVYGCDVCTSICPYNKIGKGLPCFSYDKNILFKLEEIFDYSNKSFKEKYGYYAGSWRGKKNIKRNLELIRRNRNYDKK